jgi:uncharacterized Fe-S cluster-containing protein
MSPVKHWLPPGKNCGLCGAENCKQFLRLVHGGKKSYVDCPYYQKRKKRNRHGEGFKEEGLNDEGSVQEVLEAHYLPYDILGNPYDFILNPLPGEVSARKIILPFRADLVEKMGIAEGDYVLGRPMGAGCPIPHVLKVIKAEPVTGLLYTWVVGPRFSRSPRQEIKDVVAYHMIGFEGIATAVRKEPAFGCRMTFLPGFCMMNLNHTGLVNMVLQKAEGYQVRLEDIRILAGK